mgnify:FL=1
MLFTVYFREKLFSETTLIATFLLRSDAEAFVAQSNIKTLVIKEIDKWEAWRLIREEIK